MMTHLNRNNVMLVIIDVQERLLKIMDPAITERTLFSIGLLARMFKRWGAPILISEQYPAGLGPTHAAIRQHLPELEPLEKLSFSCCGLESFNEQIFETGRTNIILTGMETHVCVQQTASDLRDRGYRVFVPIDAVQSSTKLRYRNGLHIMDRADVQLVNTESLLFQILQRCDTDEFREFQRMLKEQHAPA